MGIALNKFIITVEVATKQQAGKLQFRFLPGFAEYLKNKKLEEYIRVQVRYSREVDLPLMRFFDNMSDDQIAVISIPSTTSFLDSIINGTVQEHIEESNRKWLANRLEIIDKYDVALEDILLVSYIRKKAMQAFLPEYTAVMADALAILSEIDALNVEADIHATNTYTSILKDKLGEHSHFIERITETSPGIIYVFDLLDDKEVYANKMMTQLLGYEPEDWKELDTDFVSALIHPEDIPVIEANQKAFRNAFDGEIKSIQYRIKNKSGEYRWMRTYESIFKRTESGTPWQVIGIALDISNEKRTSDQLHRREAELLEAQTLSKMGSFIWNTAKEIREATPQFYEILNVQKGVQVEELLEKIHPGDRNKAREAFNSILHENAPLDIEFRYNSGDADKIIWIKATASINTQHEQVIQGTVMDVTERQYMIQKLKRSEYINKKAQSLTHIGNWTVDLMQNKLEWSEELYRIYGLEVGTEINREMIRAFNHPEDSKRIIEYTENAIRELRPYNFYFRIILNDGTQKTLHAAGEVLADENGVAYKAIGTLQDVTEREELIEKLKKGEILYKQAQSLSHIGNWKWNIQTEELEWSDEMYRIYGLEPQSEKITLERFKKFIHPHYKQYIEQSLSEKNKEKYDDLFRIITDAGKEKMIHSIAEMQFDEHGKQTFIIGTEQDVTEKEQLIGELRQSRELYKQALAISKVGNWSWDVEKDIVTWDEQTYKNWEIDPSGKQQLNLEFYLRSIPDDGEREKVKQAIDICYAQHQPYNITHRLLLPNGKMKYLEAKGHVIINEKGQVISMVGTGQDVTEREILIDRLQRSEQLYKQAQAIAHLGNWIYDVQSNKLFWTEELYRIYGLEIQNEAMDWDRFAAFIVEEDKEIVNAFVSEAKKAGKQFEMYHRIERKSDGVIRTVHVRGEGLIDDNGKVYQLFGTSQDVTEQQHIEQELRNNQNFIKKIADATPSIITSYNINTGRYRFISHGLRSLLGYEPTMALEKGVEFFISIVHPDDLSSLMEKNSKALETANLPENEDQDLVVDFQYRMKRSDGEYRWFHTFGTVFDRNAQGKVENVLNISIDITDRIKAEETVAEQRKFISHIAEASPTILYLFDLEKQRFLYLNKEVTAVVGYTPEEILSLGNAVYKYMHPDDAVKSEGNYIKYKHEGGVTMHQMEARIKSKSGEWKWLLTREVVFKRDENGKAIQVLGSALDITERKEMESNLSKKNVELEQSNANLEEFAYVASHDLQEPLRKIAIFGDRLVTNHKEKLDEDGKIFLEKIVDSSKRMQAMINDLLSVSLLSGDKSFSKSSLKTILNDVLQTLEFKIDAGNAKITVDDLPEANVIPSQMRQLFQNLISNSLKFVAAERTPEISVTHLLVASSEAQRLHLPVGKQYLKISIADNGIGFNNEYASKIFIIFQRLHGRFEYEGTGIGLAICKKIVENHEGIIFAEGVPGVGATFNIVLPL